MKKQIKLYIEAELRDYHQTKREYEELRDNLLNLSPNPPDGMPRGTEVSNPTYQRTVKLMTNRRIRYMEKILTSIDNVVGGLPPKKYQAVVLKYWTKPQTLTDIGISLKIDCGNATLWRWMDNVCRDIGVELGIIDKIKECMKQ